MKEKVIETLINRNGSNTHYEGFGRLCYGVFSEDELELMINNDIDRIMSELSATIYDLSEEKQIELILSKFE